MCRRRAARSAALRVQRDAARLREAHALAARGRSSTRCSRSSATTRTGSACSTRPADDRPARERVERFRPADAARPRCCTTRAARRSRGNRACRSTSSRRRASGCSRRSLLMRARRKLFGEYAAMEFFLFLIPSYCCILAEQLAADTVEQHHRVSRLFSAGMKSTGRPDFQGWVLRRVLWIILVRGVSLSKSFHSGSIRPIVAGSS